jgi:hypothetical protein
MPLFADLPLKLTTEEKSQNYYYKQIDDAAISSTEIEYKKGKLVKAWSNQSANQSTHVSKYEMGKLTEDSTTPFSASQKQDILAVLEPFLHDEKAGLPLQVYRWQQTLSDVHQRIFLRADPADMHGSGKLSGNSYRSGI